MREHMVRRPRTWLILLAVWWVTLFILSHQSHLFPPGPDIPNIDKVEHTTYFTLGGAIFFCWLRAWRPGLSFLAAAGLTILFCSVIGALDEFHQSFIENRSGNDPWDWAADTVGGLLGSLVGQWIHSRLQGREQRRMA
jgi:VanZ family protein